MKTASRDVLIRWCIAGAIPAIDSKDRNFGFAGGLVLTRVDAVRLTRGTETKLEPVSFANHRQLAFN
jgi:hypothetical protein